MHMKKKWVAVLVTLALVALFVPFVPQTQSSGQFLAAHYARTADVSPTFYVFHCGAYMNSQLATQIGSGYSGFYQISRGYSFQCNYNAQ
jgi:outer membrane lipoprotein-sorting protein